MSETFKFSDGDFHVDPVTGKLKVISGIEKAAQDLAQALMTELKQTNGINASLPRDYGSELAGVGTSYGSTFGGVGVPLVKRKIEEATNRLIALQSSDARITAEERITKIVTLQVKEISASNYAFMLRCQVASGGTTDIVTNIREATRLNQQFPITYRTDQS